MRTFAFVAAFLLLACDGSNPRSEKPAPPVKKDDPAPSLRLPTVLRAKDYEARLKLDPSKPDFEGWLKMRATIDAPRKTLWLNGTKLEVKSARIHDAQGGVDAIAQTHEKDFISLRAPRELSPGPLTIEVEYSGEIDDNATAGIFRQKDGDNWYIFTQFEATDARRAFPHIDEPSSKVPWTVSIEVPEGNIAVSNTSVEQKSESGELTRYSFGQTKPLPSYLIAFAVGPFEFVDAGKNRDGVPLRIITPKGRAGEARYAAKETGRILALLEDYLGIRYPYKKLDSIAIPTTVGFGAMEHPGLITYASTLLLATEKAEDLSFKRRYAYIAAHEIGHQWFGNLVTHAWWDDIWLNESFATWTEAVAISQFDESWGAASDVIDEKIAAMSADSIRSARRVHQPVETKSDIGNAFDGISYAKGASILRMFEYWLGKERFQKALQSYLATHKWKTATTADFLKAMNGASEGAGAAFASFVDQVGVPQVAMELRCEGSSAKLRLRQSRYRLLGQEPEAKAKRWSIPVCVRYQQNEGAKRGCFLLSEAEAEFTLPEARTCPTWVLPNAGGTGYYRSTLPSPLLKALRPQLSKLSGPERLALVDDLMAMVSAGDTDIGQVMAMIPSLANDDDRHVVERALGFLASQAWLVDDPDRAMYSRIVRASFGTRAKRLGLSPRKGDSVDDRLLRSSIVPLVASWGGDQRLRSEAIRLTRKELAKPGSLTPSTATMAFDIAAFHGNAALFDKMLAAAKAEKDRRRRVQLLSALANFPDPKLLKRAALLVLDESLDVRDTMRMLRSWPRHGQAPYIFYDFLEKNFDAVMKRVPEQSRARFAGALSEMCRKEGMAEARAFLSPRIEKTYGGPRRLTQSIERQDLCIARAEAHGAQLKKFLRGR